VSKVWEPQHPYVHGYARAYDVIKHNTVTYNDHALEETMDDDVSPEIDIRVHDTTSEGTVNTGISLFGFVATIMLCA
jgi:hypothetical protein